MLLVAIVLSHVNSLVNPFLYAFCNSTFKRAMANILSCGHLLTYDSVISGWSVSRPSKAQSVLTNYRYDDSEPVSIARETSSVSPSIGATSVSNRVCNDQEETRPMSLNWREPVIKSSAPKADLDTSEPSNIEGSLQSPTLSPDSA